MSNNDIFALHAEFCAIFSSEIRLRIMWALGEGEKTVTDLANELGISVPNTSQHLAIMRSRGAVEARREGRTIFYRISNLKFFEGASLIREGLIEEFVKKSQISSQDEVYQATATV